MVVVASDTTDIAHTTGRLGVLVALVGVIVVALAAFAAALLTRRSLQPLGRLASAAGEIERTGDPARRLPDAVVDDEVGQLTGVLNRMLSSLASSRAAERRFLADASHELRTPVTTLLGNVDYAARHGADPEVLDDLRHDAARLARLVDSLLALERAGEAGASFEPVSVDELARDVIDTAGARVVAGQLAPATVDGDPEALARALTNLVENGLVHGPAGGTVTVAVQARTAARSCGFRCPTRDPARTRTDAISCSSGSGGARRPAGRPGAGLGLSIVAAIAHAHGGSVQVEGSTFTLTLPAAEATAGESRARLSAPAAGRPATRGPAGQVGDGQRVRGRPVDDRRDGHAQLWVDVQQLPGSELAPARVVVHRLGRDDRPPAAARELVGADVDVAGRGSVSQRCRPRFGATAGLALEHVQLCRVGIAQRPQLIGLDQHEVGRQQWQVGGDPPRRRRDPGGDIPVRPGDLPRDQREPPLGVGVAVDVRHPLGPEL